LFAKSISWSGIVGQDLGWARALRFRQGAAPFAIQGIKATIQDSLHRHIIGYATFKLSDEFGNRLDAIS